MKDKPTEMADGQKEFPLEDEIKDIEKKLIDNYYQLGKEIHDTLYPKMTVINKLVDQLTAAKIQLLKISNMTICEHCLAPNSIGNKCCEKCGRKLNTEDNTENNDETE